MSNRTSRHHPTLKIGDIEGDDARMFIITGIIDIHNGRGDQIFAKITDSKNIYYEATEWKVFPSFPGVNSAITSEIRYRRAINVE